MKNIANYQHLVKIVMLLVIFAAGPSLSWANSKATASESVNINTASAEEISSRLNGIGLKKAHAIVQWREKHGNFSEVNQLTQVKGIGSKTLDRNSGRIALE
ncbi:MAG: competence protein ComE [Gammaproteobacteria bacterium]|uniref:ComEA family DNA-binding protein n=1 Tax=Pseudomaricurvus alcaniphilus TaxID=1166482 RepID=UPI001407C68D|nr:helix-hairpin-helix domain-containing protein [Pseudomaricurvus alcaniphilus]MBR9910094.1 competence protein ComE [Gammaproteobacteria bacterium]NHN36610.1 competence protein ComE [Pseudomaricurvus alcaniphilus]